MYIWVRLDSLEIIYVEKIADVVTIVVTVATSQMWHLTLFRLVSRTSLYYFQLGKNSFYSNSSFWNFLKSELVIGLLEFNTL